MIARGRCHRMCLLVAGACCSVGCGSGSSSEPDGGDGDGDAHAPDGGAAQEEEFLLGIRGYPGGGIDAEQFGMLAELGSIFYDAYDHRFFWHEVEPSRDAPWDWTKLDAYLEVLESQGLKAFAACLYPKSQDPDLWIYQLDRDELAEQYAEYCAAVVEHCRGRPSWLGYIKVNGTSADTFSAFYSDENPLSQLVYDPVLVAQRVDAAYEAIKAVDPDAVVVAFNQGALASGDEHGNQWERWHRDLLGENPRFDFFGFHGAPDNPCAFCPSPDDPVQGIAGFRMIRDLLDENGRSATPMFESEMSTVLERSGGDTAEQMERNHAIYDIESIVLSRTTPSLRGYVVYNLFVATNETDYDSGLFEPFDKDTLNDPPVQLPAPRDAWFALETLVQKVGFLGYRHDGTESGELGGDDPWVLRFVALDDASSRLWVVFSPSESGEQSPVRLQIAPATSATLIDLMGETSTVVPSDGVVEIVPAFSPVYLVAR